MLFRKEVAGNIQSHQTGQVLLLTGWPVWLTVIVTLLFFIALVLFLVYGNYTRQVNVSGEVNSWPHTADLFAPEEGVIAWGIFSPVFLRLQLCEPRSLTMLSPVSWTALCLLV
jgi:membrane fusion protein